MKLRLSRDENGNKVLKVSVAGLRGFSVQTLVNMPKTHKMKHGESFDEETALQELNAYISRYGTQKQKDFLKCANHGDEEAYYYIKDGELLN